MAAVDKPPRPGYDEIQPYSSDALLQIYAFFPEIVGHIMKYLIYQFEDLGYDTRRYSST